MPSKIPKDRWNALIQEHRAGKTIAQIVRENGDVKKSTFRYHIKKANDSLEEPEGTVQTAPLVQDHVQDQDQASTPKPAVRTAPRIQVRDDFLNSMMPKSNSNSNSNSRSAPMQSSAVDSLFGNQQSSNAVDSLFSVNDIFSPENLSKSVPAPEKVKPLAGKSATWWLSSSNLKEKQAPTKSEIALNEDNEQLMQVQKIRLYFVHFPELAKLHIVTRKRGTDEPDTEKWLISLYNKKPEDLDKILNFVRFHVRNNINENSSVKIASNVLETSVKVIEHVLMVVGVQSQNLTKNVMEDEDIIRCVKEILIDNSITSLNLGPKSDLMLKLGMKVVSCDSQNRIENQMQAAERAKEARVRVAAKDSPLVESLAEKYQDL